MTDDAKSPTWRGFSVQALILAALVVAAFPGVFLRGELISSADILFKVRPWAPHAPEGFEEPNNVLMFDPLMAFRPDYVLTQRALWNGEWPVWNPLEYGGVPLLANCQSTVFYPLRLLLVFVDVDWAMTLFVLLKVWLCGATAYVCARVLGLSVPGSRFFSVGWTVGYFCLVWANWPITDVCAWVPALFMGVELILRGMYRRGFSAMCFGGTLMLLAGHAETGFTFGLGMGYFFVARLLWERRWGARLWRPILVCSAAWAMVLLVFSAQLAPFGEYLLHSWTFQARDVQELDIPMPAGAVITFWIPRFFGTDAEGTFYDQGKWNSNVCSPQYIGMAAWCGVMLLLARVQTPEERKRWRPFVGCLLIAGITGAMLSFHFPSLAWIHELPVFSSLLEIYHIIFLLFALPLLGALGLDRWFSRKRKLRELAWLLPLIFVVAALTWFTYDFHAGLIEKSGHAEYVRTQIHLAIAAATLSVLVLAAHCIWSRPRVFWALVTVVLAADHLVATRGLNPTLSRELVFPDVPLMVYLRDKPKPCRVGVSEAAIMAGVVCNYEVEEWIGYDGLYPERAIRYQKELGPDVWEVMEPVNSIKYYLNDPEYEASFPLEELIDAGRLTFDRTLDELDVYRNDGAFERAFLAAGIEVIPDRDALFARMLEDGFDPKRVAPTQVAPPGPLPSATGEDLGDVRIEQYDATYVRVAANANEDAVLVLSDAFYPGWRAYIDGEEVDLFPAYYAHRGLILPAGDHVVEYMYRPWSLRIGLAISSAALLTSIVCGLYWLRRRAPGVT